MFKLAAIAVFSFGIAVGCSSSSITPRTTIPASSTETASALADHLMSKHETIPATLTLTATATRCYCGDGWSFAMSPCNQTQCGNLCVHGHGTGGFCR